MKTRNQRLCLTAAGFLLALACALGLSQLAAQAAQAQQEITYPANWGWESPLTDEENAALSKAMSLKNKQQGEPYDDAGLLTYRSKNGEVTIMSCSEAAVGDLYIPSAINGEPVTAINDYAFLFCTALTSVTLPASVDTVGNYAFFCCTNLQSVTFQGYVETVGSRAFYRDYALTEVHFTQGAGALKSYAFGGCTSLVTVELPHIERLGDYAFTSCFSLTGLPLGTDGETVLIGSYVFSKCTGLTDVTIPARVSGLGVGVFSQCTSLERAAVEEGVRSSSMGNRMFYECTALASVSLPSYWTKIPDEAFYNCAKLSYRFPDNLTEIGYAAFYGCTSLPKDLVLPSGVTTLGKLAFENCDPASVTIPASLTEIPERAFNACPSLKRVSLPEGLLTIGEYAFGGNSLESLTLPSTLETLEEGVFWESADGSIPCAGTVSEITLPESLTYLGDYALACCTGIDIDELVLPESLTYFGVIFDGFKRITLPETLATVAPGAFRNCKSLEEVTILCPETAFANYTDTLSRYFFSGCSSLTSVSFPDTWTTFPAYMFSNCALTNVTIPEGITVIGTNAFSYSSALETVELPSTLKTIRTNAFTSCKALKEIQLPAGLTYIGDGSFCGDSALTSLELPEGLINIGKKAFASSGLTSVTLPGSVERLGESVFSGCGNLTQVTLQADYDGATSIFANCSGLTSVTVAEGVTTVQAGFFQGCTNLRNVSLPSTLKTIGGSAFNGCTALSEIRLPEGLEVIQRNAFCNTGLTEISLPSSLTRLEPGAFSQCAGLASVCFADGIPNDAFRVIMERSESAGGMEGYWGYSSSAGTEEAKSEGLFAGCSALSEVRLPEAWTYIPAKFFKNCGGPLGELVLGGHITAIGSNAFENAVGVTSIVFPAGVVSIGDYAFSNCTGLTSLELPDEMPVEGLGDYAIAGCSNLVEVSLPSSWDVIPDGLFQNNQSIRRYEIPEGVVRIGEYAFAGSALAEVTLPGTLTEIGAYAFQGCAALTEVTLPGSLTEIGAYAFQDCAALAQVSLPAGLETLGEFSFSGTGLTQVTVPAAAIGHMAFYNCDSLVSAQLLPGVTTVGPLAFSYCDRLETVSMPDSAVNLARTIFYGSNPGGVTIQCSADSMAEEMVQTLLYLASNNSPRLEGARFIFQDDQKLLEANASKSDVNGAARDGYVLYMYTDLRYYVDYQSMSFKIVNGQAMAHLKTSPSNYRFSMTNYLCSETDLYAAPVGKDDYYAELVGWDPELTELTVPDDVGGIPVRYFASGTAGEEQNDYATYTMYRVEWEDKTAIRISLVGQLRTLTLGANIEVAGGDLSYCTGLETIIFSEGVTEIEAGTFQGMTNLNSVELPASLKTIGEDAFQGCANLSGVTFQEGLTFIGEEAFAGTALTEVYLPATLEELHATAFDSGVVFHFTGDAGKLKYAYYKINEQGVAEKHIVYALPDLLESVEVTVAQFTGNGLDGQADYFISTESAGLAVPDPGMAGEAAGGAESQEEAAGTPENWNAPNEAVYENEPSPAQPEEEPEPDVEEEEEKLTVYELIRNVAETARSNPLATALLAAVVLALIAFGAGHHWLAARKEEREEARQNTRR